MVVAQCPIISSLSNISLSLEEKKRKRGSKGRGGRREGENGGRKSREGKHKHQPEDAR